MKKSSKRFILSDESQNLYGFKVITNGIQLDDFKLNPVCLYNHDYNKLLGLWTDLQIQGTQLTGVPEFDENDTEAMLYYSKAEQGILKGASIGITPIQFDEATQTMTKCALKETSLTPVPANKSAIALYSLSGSKLDVSDVKNYLLSVTSLVASSIQLNNLSSSDKILQIDAAILKNPALSAAKSTLIYIAENMPNDLSAILTRYENNYHKGSQIASLKEKTFDEYALNEPAELELMQRNDPAKFQRLLSAKVASVRLSGQVSNDDFMDYGNNQPVLGAIIEGTYKTYDEYALHAPNELELMQRNDPTKFQRLLSAKVASVRLGGQISNDGFMDYGNYQPVLGAIIGGTYNTYDEYALHAPKELELMQRNDPAKFQMLLSAKVASVRLSGQISNDGFMDYGNYQPVLGAITGDTYKTYDEYALHAPNELELIQRNDPAKFQRLLSAKIASVRLSGQISNDGF
ncbi:HK97 family phage prohead protease [Mucilaginibacter sp.]|uniref:HK97 family phage prohead protease n=1 Tax=Mucilaginibacter sp. TaxID=1882438 RepID=UPI0025CFDF0E|nr:HK97 family phage prohead protease [Mucilaginibacter sp.]